MMMMMTTTMMMMMMTTMMMMISVSSIVNLFVQPVYITETIIVYHFVCYHNNIVIYGRG